MHPENSKSLQGTRAPNRDVLQPSCPAAGHEAKEIAHQQSKGQPM